MHSSLKYHYPAAIWGVLTCLACLMPSNEAVKNVPVFEGFDKLVHTGLFFMFTVLLFRGNMLQGRQGVFSYSAWTTILFLNIVLGGGIELVQWKIVTSRSGDWWDFFADMVGVGMGMFSYIALYDTKK